MKWYEKLRKLREEKGMSADEANRAAGEEHGVEWYREMENGRIPHPRAHFIQRLAKRYGVTMEFVVDETLGMDDRQDARLAASAPELLEALVEIMKRDDGYGPDGSGFELSYELRDKAFSAISKATGEEPLQ